MPREVSSEPDLVLLAGRLSAERVDPVDLRQFHDFAPLRAFKNGFDDPLVLQAFFARRIWFAIVHHAICHVIQLVGELVGLANLR